MSMITILGIIGALIILIAFILNETNRWKNNGWQYDATNFVGSILLIIYAILLHSIPFFILNAVWAAVSFRDLILDWKTFRQKGKK